MQRWAAPAKIEFDYFIENLRSFFARSPTGFCINLRSSYSIQKYNQEEREIKFTVAFRRSEVGEILEVLVLEYDFAGTRTRTRTRE